MESRVFSVRLSEHELSFVPEGVAPGAWLKGLVLAEIARLGHETSSRLGSASEEERLSRAVAAQRRVLGGVQGKRNPESIDRAAAPKRWAEVAVGGGHVMPAVPVRSRGLFGVRSVGDGDAQVVEGDLEDQDVGGDVGGSQVRRGRRG
jgi:hypothetical protein